MRWGPVEGPRGKNWELGMGGSAPRFDAAASQEGVRSRKEGAVLSPQLLSHGEKDVLWWAFAGANVLQSRRQFHSNCFAGASPQ